MNCNKNGLFYKVNNICDHFKIKERIGDQNLKPNLTKEEWFYRVYQRNLSRTSKDIIYQFINYIDLIHKKHVLYAITIKSLDFWKNKLKERVGEKKSGQKCYYRPFELYNRKSLKGVSGFLFQD